MTNVGKGTIGEYEVVLMLSTDGVQLYESKQPDCWTYLWIIVNLEPRKCYKIQSILPGGDYAWPQISRGLRLISVSWLGSCICASMRRLADLGLLNASNTRSHGSFSY